MAESTRDLILTHWRLANARDWPAFARLLHPALAYEAPQTREYIETGAGYLDMFVTWPGHWQAEIRRLVCEPTQSVCIIDFKVDGQVMTGISVFDVADGLITRVTDYWPDPYDPPPRVSSHMKRRPV